PADRRDAAAHARREPRASHRQRGAQLHPLAHRMRALLLALVLAGCREPTPAPACGAAIIDDREMPAPVTVRLEPQVALADPAFVALPGARAEYGRLHGAVFQLEMPDAWNGDVVFWMHGFENFAAEASTTAPDFRRYLIRHGYAWAASSFSSTSMIPQRAADE